MNKLARSSLAFNVACAVLVLVVLLGGCGQNPSGPYLGQTPPGNTPQLFAASFIRSEVHGVTVFSPDGSEVYWSLWSDRGEQTTMYSRLEGEKWTSPTEATFSTTGGAGNPCFSTDGKSLLFTSKRQPGKPDDPAEKENIWQTHRTGTGWSTPTRLPQAINELDVHWLFSLTDDGDLYFGAAETRGIQRDIYRARLVEGEYAEVTKLGPEINTEQFEDCPFVARDGSYLIFTRLNAARTDADLLISFRAADGGWGEAVNMGPAVNSIGNEISPWVTYDNKYLFFVSNRRGRAEVFWVSAEIIEDLGRAARGNR